MTKIVREVFALLGPAERRQLKWLFAGMVFMAIIEVAGVGSVMPFMSLVINPSLIETNTQLRYIYHFLGFESVNYFLIFCGIVVLVILIISNVFSAWITWAIFRFSWMRNHDLSKRLLSKYLSQPYSFFLNRNSSEMSRNILGEVRIVISGIIVPFLRSMRALVLSIFILALLVSLDPVLAVIVSLALGGTYAVFFLLVNKKLREIGEQRAEANKMRFKATNEVLNGIKEIKMLEREFDFLKKFSVHSRLFARHQALKSSIGWMPKFFLEILAFGGILIITLYLLIHKGQSNQVIPVIALYAFAAQRLMPAMQTIFAGITNIRYSTAALNILTRDMKTTEGEVRITGKRYKEAVSPLRLNEKLELCDILFYYPQAEKPAVEIPHLKIEANITVGVAGATGSGKTTVIDILIGLLRPRQGSIIVDGLVLDEKSLRRWKKNIGYASQHVFLSDDTVKSNIAFGVPQEKINQDRIIWAAKVAHIHEFVIKELENGYSTMIGERGVRLSGGQRQRIGIARVLYNDPQVLVLDEATSALDGVTEKKVLESIFELAGQKTIIIVTHRIGTLKNCSKLFFIENGRIAEEGTFQQLMAKNEKFRSMSLWD